MSPINVNPRNIPQAMERHCARPGILRVSLAQLCHQNSMPPQIKAVANLVYGMSPLFEPSNPNLCLRTRKSEALLQCSCNSAMASLAFTKYESELSTQTSMSKFTTRIVVEGRDLTQCKGMSEKVATYTSAFWDLPQPDLAAVYLLACNNHFEAGSLQQTARLDGRSCFFY